MNAKIVPKKGELEEVGFFRVVEFGVRDAGCKLRVASWELGVAGWGLGVAGWEIFENSLDEVFVSS